MCIRDSPRRAAKPIPRRSSCHRPTARPRQDANRQKNVSLGQREMTANHTLFIGNAAPFQGSTALEMTIMSDPKVATFCEYVTWECELNAQRMHMTASNGQIMSLLWRPSVHTVFSKWIDTPLSPSVWQVLNAKGIFPKVNVITMFQPPCLYTLSTHQRSDFKKNASVWARKTAEAWKLSLIHI